MIRRGTVCCAVLLLAGVAQLFAQRRGATPQLDKAQPCCSITAIDARTGTVTARVTATGATFRFEVEDRALLRALRVGGAVWADFASGGVGVDRLEPCCNITSGAGVAAAQNAARPAEPVGQPGRNPAEPVGTPGQAALEPSDPCCAITAIDARTGIVTARIAGTNRTFRFEVKDAALLRSLTVGQRVSADFGTNRVRIHGLAPCCPIVGHEPGLEKEDSR